MTRTFHDAEEAVLLGKSFNGVGDHCGLLTEYSGFDDYEMEIQTQMPCALSLAMDHGDIGFVIGSEGGEQFYYSGNNEK